MLDLGFIVPLRKIVKMVPAKRQTLFFSATMPKTIAELADAAPDRPGAGRGDAGRHDGRARRAERDVRLRRRRSRRC